MNDAVPAADLPPDVDTRIWFEISGCEGRHFFVDGNPHIRESLYAYCPVKRIKTRASKYEITASSDEAAYFVRGFLSGTEPPPPVDEEGMLVEGQTRLINGVRPSASGERLVGERLRRQGGPRPSAVPAMYPAASCPSTIKLRLTA